MAARRNIKPKSNAFPRKGNFTLVELLVAVSIVGILAAIALPNFLEAQTRAKVSSALSHTRLLADAAEAYRVDWNHYPIAAQRLPMDPYGVLSDVQLAVLTTPVAYTSSAAFRDPFGKIQCRTFVLASYLSPQSDFPIPDPPNSNKSLLYYNYQCFAKWTHNPLVNAVGIALVSIGPDRQDSFGVFRPFTSEALPPLALQAGIRDPLDTQYDPTNGTISGGDIFGFAGELPLRR